MTTSDHSYAWGKTGHRIVAELAKQKISTKTHKKIKKILGFESMEEASLWPDRIKSDSKLRRKYSKMHYLSIPKKKKLKKNMTSEGSNILTALKGFEKVLRSREKPLKEKRIALRFLIHLMGDLHQPLHIGYRKDAGGNNISLKWFDDKTNLHAIWDEKLIEMEKLSYTEYVKKLIAQDPKKLESYRSGNYFSWAQESRSLLPLVYDFKQHKFWEYSYSYRYLETVDKRLSQAGLRLALVLESIFKS